MFGDLASAYLGWLPGQPLEAVLPTIWCWGVLEKADAFANRMSELTGRSLTLSQSNVTRQVEVLDISVAARRKIERLYARDLELHARCGQDYG